MRSSRSGVGDTWPGVFFLVAMETFEATYAGTKWRNPKEPDSKFLIGITECGVGVMGDAADGELFPGLQVRFYGRWDEHSKYGKQFKFQQFQKIEPHDRAGVEAYLCRYAPGIGPGLAGQLFDVFGGDAVKILRTQPEETAKLIPRLTLATAMTAAEELRKLVKLEDAKIDLTSLFAGRGFFKSLVDDCIERWGILAAARVKRDPFCLLVAEFSGCGFARCDRLYQDLGLPLERLKRQMLCLWHTLNEDMSGSTWIPAEFVVLRLGEMVGGAKIRPNKAVRLGVRSGWLAEDMMEIPAGSGRVIPVLAIGKKARNERRLAELIVGLL